MSGGMKIKFKLDGVSDFEKALDDAKGLKAVKSIIKTGGAELQKQAQRNMTQKYTGHMEGTRHVMPTGATRRSTELHIEDGGLTARVTIGTEYFPYLELGTRFMTARPTLKPAFTMTVKQVEALLNRLKR